MSYVLLVPVVVLLGVYMLYRRANRKVFGPVSVVLGLYFLMSVASIVLALIGISINRLEINAWAIVYLTVLLTVALWGLLPYRDHSLVSISIDNIMILRIVGDFLLVSSTLGLAFFAFHAIPVLSGDLLESRVHLEIQMEELGKLGLVNSFFSVIANLFGVGVMIGMLYLNPAFVRARSARVKAWALLLSSTIYIVYVFAYVGRDGPVLWLLTTGFIYLLLKRFIPVRDRRIVVGLIIAVGTAALVPFAAISWARFDQSELGVWVALLRYGGGQIQQFSDYFSALDPLAGGWINFPTVRTAVDQLLGSGSEAFDRADWIADYVSLGVEPWKFATFVGAFLFDFGYVGTVFLVVAIAITSRVLLRGVRRTGSFALSAMTGWIALAQIVVFGVFYFRQALANLSLLAVVLLAFSFRLLRRDVSRRTIGIVA